MGTTDSISQRLANGEVVILDGDKVAEANQLAVAAALRARDAAATGPDAVAGPISAEGLPGRVAEAGKEASAR